MAAYRLATDGVVRTSDGAFIPDDVRNSDWNTYQVWLAVPNTPDPVATISLPDYQATQSANVNREANSRRQAAATLWPVDYLRFREAVAAAADGTPTAPEYPLLDAQAQAEGDTIANIALAVIAEDLAARTAMAPVEQARREGLMAIAGAASNAAVDAAVAAIAWP